MDEEASPILRDEDHVLELSRAEQRASTPSLLQLLFMHVFTQTRVFVSRDSHPALNLLICSFTPQEG
ncbi:uncharacterized [Tachysurus ichikawai]